MLTESFRERVRAHVNAHPRVVLASVSIPDNVHHSPDRVGRARCTRPRNDRFESDSVGRDSVGRLLFFEDQG